MSRHKNYEILNLIGYGLAKFDGKFEGFFGCDTKRAFYQYIVDCHVAETVHVVKNRRDLFDPYFDNSRAGWWKSKDQYIHRKILIDSLYGNLSAKDFAGLIRQYLNVNFDASDQGESPIQPIQKSRFKQLQETGLEAELYFQHNYEQVDMFVGGVLDDARLLCLHRIPYESEISDKKMQ